MSKKWTLIVLFFTFFSIDSDANYTSWIDSLGLDPISQDNKAEVLEAFMLRCNDNIGYNTLKLEQLANAMYYHAEKWDSVDRQAQALNFIGIALQFNGNIDSALTKHNEALRLFRSTQNRSLTGHTLKVLGNAYYQKGLYEKCIENYLEAKSIAKELGDQGTEISLTHNLSVIYKSVGNYERSIEMIYEVLNYAKANKDSMRLFNSYNTLANVFYAKDPSNFDSTFHYYKLAEQHINKNVPPSSISLVYTNLSTVCFNTTVEGNRTKYLRMAYDYAKKAYPYLSQSRADQRFHIYRSLGQASLELNKKNALPYLDSAYYYAKLIGDFYSVKDACEPLFKYYYKKGNDSLGWKYYIEFSQMMDSIHHYDRIRAVEEAEAKFKTQEALLSKLETELESEQKTKQNEFLVAVLVGLIALILSVLLFYRSRIKGKELQLKTSELDHQKQLIQSNIEAEERERRRIARDLHDGVGQYVSSVVLGIENISKNHKEIKPELTEVKDKANEALDLVRNLSHQMMPVALQKYGLISALESLMDYQNKHSKAKCNFEYFNSDKLNLSDSQNIHLYRITQEHLQNVHKHADPTYVNVQLYIQLNNLHLVLVNDGKKEVEESGGMGTHNIMNRVSLIGGSISFEQNASEFKCSVKMPL